MNTVNLQYERLLTSNEDFTCVLHDFTRILLSITVQGVEPNVNPVNLMVFSYWRFFNKNTHFHIRCNNSVLSV